MADETSTSPAATLSPAVAVGVDSLVAGAYTQGHTPALTVAVARAGEVAHVSSAGAGLDGAQSRIGSISKTFTAVLLMGLRDEGRLSLDTPIGDLLPGVDLPGVTPRNLLAHRSGLRREPSAAFTNARTDPGRAWWERAAGGDVTSLLADVDTGALIHRPWRKHHYSNLGYGLLGAVVEKVAGQPWREALRARVLDPLGLTRTTYEPQAPYATGYVVFDGVVREEPRPDAGAMAPAGQLWSTVTDLARWTGFWAAPGGLGMLDGSTVDEMCVPASMEDVSAWTSGHGLGIQLWRSGDRVYAGHTGSMPGYLAVMMTHRESGTAVVGFANSYTLVGGTLQGLAQRVLDVVLDEQPTGTVMAPPAISSIPADVADLLGTWWWMGRRHDVGWDGELVMSYHGEPSEPWRFTPDGLDRWRCRTGMNDGEAMVVRRAADGAPIGLDVATFYFTRDPWPDLDHLTRSGIR
jgi:CubicO group peptidase (beta-lactamase class C family)